MLAGGGMRGRQIDRGQGFGVLVLRSSNASGG